MTLESKKELLRYKMLNENPYYDVTIYRLFRYNYLDNVISKINDKSFSFDIDIKDDEIKVKQFISLLEEFMKITKNYFFNIRPIEFIISNIVESNIDKMEEYLSLKCDIKDNNSIVNEKIYKIYISNFINNIKYVPAIEMFLTENHINIKTIDDYSLNECQEILSLLSDLVFCQRGRGKLAYLFENIENNLVRHLGFIKNKKNQKYDDEYYQNKYISNYISNYNSIFKSYNSKKKYLRHFE